MKEDRETLKRLKAIQKAIEAGKFKLQNQRKRFDYSEIPDDITVYCGDDKHVKK